MSSYLHFILMLLVTTDLIAKIDCLFTRFLCVRFWIEYFSLILFDNETGHYITKWNLQLLPATLNSQKILPRQLTELIVLKITSEFVMENSFYWWNRWLWCVNGTIHFQLQWKILFPKDIDDVAFLQTEYEYLVAMIYPFVAITLRSTLTWSGSHWLDFS